MCVYWLCTETSNFFLAEQIALHLIWTLLLPVKKKKKIHSRWGHVQVGNEECLGTKTCSFILLRFSKTGRVGLYQLLEKTPTVGKSLLG